MASRLLRPGYASGVVVGLLLLVLGACRPATSVPADPIIAPSTLRPPPESVPRPLMTATATLPPATAAPTIPPPPSPTPQQAVATAVATLSSSQERSPTATPPPPTYTPPPPPPPVVGEHLFLQRPVPTSSPAWTDKAYPYGSTRGGRLRPHTGVEFNVPSGTPVLAVAPGTVVVVGDDSEVAFGPQANFYGNLVVLQLETDGETPVFALYGHLSEVGVEVGQTVTAGQALGLSGASGVADGPHLHFEVRVGDNDYLATRNPLLWLTPLPGTGVVAGRVLSAAGDLLHEAPVYLQRVDATAPYTATTSYALGEPNADGSLGENFAADDVEPGFYQVIVDDGTRRHTQELWVFPGRVNWVEVTLAR